MAVACIVALLLDNGLPGTAKERGIERWRRIGDDSEGNQLNPTISLHVYDPISSKLWMNKPWLKYIPFLPYYSNDGKSGEDAIHIELKHVKSLDDSQ